MDILLNVYFSIIIADIIIAVLISNAAKERFNAEHGDVKMKHSTNIYEKYLNLIKLIVLVACPVLNLIILFAEIFFYETAINDIIEDWEDKYCD